ncbi:unnamed protein product [Phytophthora lilii]|uniref:Unnamed protein product n=1 Tax=Phytophthora lilii TaxID=2077276 RepID=A0A9W6WXZ2_9STRA|nr:unnamed protein product [Phytophthora lilii]
MADKQKPHEDVLTRLVRDLETKKTLLHVKDYPGVELEQLHQHVKKVGPLVNPVFGEQPAFFDEGRFVPFRVVVGNEKVVAKISRILDEWATWSGEGGRVTTSQGAFIFGTDVRMPRFLRKLFFTPSFSFSIIEQLHVVCFATKSLIAKLNPSRINLKEKTTFLYEIV